MYNKLDRVKFLLEKNGFEIVYYNPEPDKSYLKFKFKDKIRVLSLSDQLQDQLQKGFDIVILTKKAFEKMNEFDIYNIITSEEISGKITLNNINLAKNIPQKIAEYIYNNPNTHIRAIARALDIHPQTVKRYVDRASKVLELKKIKNPSLPNLPVLIKMKEGFTPEDFLENVLSNKMVKKTKKSRKKKKKRNKSKKTNKPKLRRIFEIASFLYHNPNTHIRAIARALDISPTTVYNDLKEIGNFVVFTPLHKSLDYEVKLPKLPVMVRLKEGVTPEGIVRYMRFKELLKR